jgi:hypothetical protein
MDLAYAVKLAALYGFLNEAIQSRCEIDILCRHSSKIVRLAIFVNSTLLHHGDHRKVGASGRTRTDEWEFTKLLCSCGGTKAKLALPHGFAP